MTDGDETGGAEADRAAEADGVSGTGGRDDADGDPGPDEDAGSTEVPVVCPACETTTRVPLSDLAATLDRHNDRLHGGEEVATVDPDLADHLLDLVADDLLEQ